MFSLFLSPCGKLSQKLHILLAEDEKAQTPLGMETQRRPGPKDLASGISEDPWPMVLARVENHESSRKIAADSSVSRETRRRFVRTSKRVGSSGSWFCQCLSEARDVTIDLCYSLVCLVRCSMMIFSRDAGSRWSIHVLRTSECLLTNLHQ
jgi:hypothetical protein